MKAIIYQQFGNTDVLQMTDQPVPSVKTNQVLVKVKAVSINPMDWKIRKGEMKLMSGSKFPKQTGVDFAGIVEETGAAVTGFKKGEEVFGVVKNMMKDGAMAGYVAVPSSLIWKKPSTIDFAQAASIPVVGAAAVTALQKMGDIGAQTSILVNGATGGFGMFLLQLLKQTNAQVTAVAGTGAVETAKRWGAGSVIDYTKENVLSQGNRYDVVIDLSGKMGYTNAKRIMNYNALFLDPTPVEIPVSVLRNIVTGKKHIPLLSGPSKQNIDLVLNAIQNGLEIEVSKVFSIDQAKEAYQYAEKGGYTGKTVVQIN